MLPKLLAWHEHGRAIAVVLVVEQQHIGWMVAAAKLTQEFSSGWSVFYARSTGAAVGAAAL